MFAGVEEGVGAAFGLAAECLDNVVWADGVVRGVRFVQTWKVVSLMCEECYVGGSLRRKSSWRASITGVGTSSASALAFMASMCGCRYVKEASA